MDDSVVILLFFVMWASRLLLCKPPCDTLWCTSLNFLLLSKCSQSALVNKNNALPKIKLDRNTRKAKSVQRVIAHQTEEERASANEQSRQRMGHIRAV
ncbi:hypothetical protein TNCV_481931 [Trichonephila clavipes]|nr:hypothetical protein TNCV_481931 [Trichonephila clavipes]